MSLRVTALTVYPVKSLRGIALDEADLAETGFRYDRAWMVIDDWGSFLSQRQHPSMARIDVRAAEDHLEITIPGEEPQAIPIVTAGPRIEARVWGHRCVVVDQGLLPAEILSGFLGRACRLVRMAPDFRRELSPTHRRRGDGPVGFADSMPFLLASEASLADLNSRLASPTTMRRFRPNIVVDGTAPFQEESWRSIRIADMKFRVAKHCLRCEMINVDQVTGSKGIEPMETLEGYHSGPKGVAFGVNLVHEGSGRLRVGDEVEVLE